MASLQVRRRWWRWIITLATFLQCFLANGFLYNYSILFVSLQEEFFSSLTITGWLGSVANALSALVSPLTVLLEHNLSQRSIVLVGVVVFSAGLLATSFVPAIGYAYLTFGVLVGVGANFMTHSSMSLLLDWFAKSNYSRASNMALLGTTSGMLAFSPLLTACITHYGWRNALRILSGGIFVVGIADGFLLTNPPTDEDYTTVQDQSQNMSQDQNHEIENIVPMKEIRDGCMKETDAEGQESEDDKTNVKEVDDCNVSLQEPHVNHCRGMFDMMKNLEPWLWSIGNISSFIGWTFFNINFASFMEGHGLHSNQIASVIVFFACGELGGKMLIAVIGDRLPFMHLYLVVASCLMGAVVLGLMTIAKTYLTITLIAAASGLIRSGVYGGIWVADAQLFHGTYGTNNVTILSLVPSGVGILVSAPLSGVLFDITGDYSLSLLVIVAIFLCASVAFLSIPIRRRVQSRGRCCSPNTRTVHL